MRLRKHKADDSATRVYIHKGHSQPEYCELKNINNITSNFNFALKDWREIVYNVTSAVKIIGKLFGTPYFC